MVNHRNTRILLVHRDAGACLRLVVRLRRQGFDCIACRNIDDIAPERSVCDVFVSDLDALSNEKSGSDQRTNRLRDVPEIVIAPADSDPRRVRAAFRRGAFDVVPAGDFDRLYEAVTASRCNAESLRASTGRLDTDFAVDEELQVDLTSGLLTRHGFSAALTRMRTRARSTAARVGVIALASENRTQTDQAVREIGRTLSTGVAGFAPIVCFDGVRFLVSVEAESVAPIDGFAEDIKTRLSGENGVGSGIASGGGRFFVGTAVSGVGCAELETDLITRAVDALDFATERNATEVVSWSQLSSAAPSRRRLGTASPEKVAQWIDRSRQQIKRGCIESVLTLVEAVEAKEPGALGHARQVSHYCELIARGMGFSDTRIEAIRTAALLHDIGKIGVPDAILRKPGPLDSDEFDVIKRHPETAIQILVHSSFLGDELGWILHHHERFDGTGYPHRLSGQDIPLEARILSVADAIDAMRSVRNYKRGNDVDIIRDQLIRGSGNQFDPDVVEVAMRTIIAEFEPLPAEPAHTL